MNMGVKLPPQLPKFDELIQPAFTALKNLGGSGSNGEIYDQVVAILNLPAKIVDVPHTGRANLTEVEYRLAWAKTYLRKYGVIENSTRSVWSILPEYVSRDTLNVKEIVRAVRNIDSKRGANELSSSQTEEGANLANTDAELPDEVKPWRAKLSEILRTMNPYGFERLAQRLLRECGFSQVEVTKKSGDGGIDGTGKLKINGIFSFRVAFQCKRYSGLVGASAIRDFRGSLTTDIEKAVLITTGAFSKAARDEATVPGKQQIDLMDGEELVSKIAELGIGVKEVKTYEIDEEFFEKI